MYYAAYSPTPKQDSVLKTTVQRHTSPHWHTEGERRDANPRDVNKKFPDKAKKGLGTSNDL